jgi:hypothetical protein
MAIPYYFSSMLFQCTSVYLFKIKSSFVLTHSHIWEYCNSAYLAETVIIDTDYEFEQNKAVKCLYTFSPEVSFQWETIDIYVYFSLFFSFNPVSKQKSLYIFNK